MITTREAAQRSRLTQRRIRQLCESGELVADRIETARGPLWMVDEASLDRRRGDNVGTSGDETRGVATA